jgi:hypothetical protein
LQQYRRCPARILRSEQCFAEFWLFRRSSETMGRIFLHRIEFWISNFSRWDFTGTYQNCGIENQSWLWLTSKSRSGSPSR